MIMMMMKDRWREEDGLYTVTCLAQDHPIYSILFTFILFYLFFIHPGCETKGARWNRASFTLFLCLFPSFLPRAIFKFPFPASFLFHFIIHYKIDACIYVVVSFILPLRICRILHCLLCISDFRFCVDKTWWSNHTINGMDDIIHSLEFFFINGWRWRWWD